MLDRTQVKRDVILCLIPTSSYASLQPSAKDQIIAIADMLVDYIFAPEEKAKPTPTNASKKGQKATSPK